MIYAVSVAQKLARHWHLIRIGNIFTRATHCLDWSGVTQHCWHEVCVQCQHGFHWFAVLSMYGSILSRSVGRQIGHNSCIQTSHNGKQVSRFLASKKIFFKFNYCLPKNTVSEKSENFLLKCSSPWLLRLIVCKHIAFLLARKVWGKKLQLS